MVERAISVCALCGQALDSGTALCAHHQRRADDGWAIENRIICNLIHRGIVPPRLSAAERAEAATHAADAA
jgi:hypothetical protein